MVKRVMPPVMNVETSMLRKLRPSTANCRVASFLSMSPTTCPIPWKALEIMPPTIRAPRMVPGSDLTLSQAKVMDSQMPQS